MGQSDMQDFADDDEASAPSRNAAAVWQPGAQINTTCDDGEWLTLDDQASIDSMRPDLLRTSRGASATTRSCSNSGSMLRLPRAGSAPATGRCTDYDLTRASARGARRVSLPSAAPSRARSRPRRGSS